MSSVNDIVSTLQDKTVTLGWDVVVAYDRAKVNQLFDQQYVEKVFNGEHFPEVNKKIESGLNTISLNNIKFGPPRISFENSAIEESKATARIDFLSGTMITQDNKGRVISREIITPALGYRLELGILLEQGKGSVNTDDLVQINFEKASLQVIDGIQNPPVELMEFFRGWLKNNAVSYTLGVLNLAGNEILTPTDFRIRTQPAPGAKLKAADNHGDGAVLLFISTKYNQTPGELPNNSYPYLLPDEHSCAVLLSSKVLFEHYFLKPLANQVKGVSLSLGRVNNQRDAAYLINFKGEFDTGSSHESQMIREEGGGTSYIATTYAAVKGNDEESYIESHARVSLDNFTVRGGGHDILLGWVEDHHFEQPIGAKIVAISVWGSSTSYQGKNFEFKVKPSLTGARFDVNNNSSLSINYDAVDYDITNVTETSSWWWLGTAFQAVATGVKQAVSQTLKNNLNVNIPEINLFLVSNLLFPNKNVFLASEAHVPGDLVLFGDINPKQTAFKVSPLESVVAIKESVQFKTEPSTAVDWSVTPAIGSIDKNGLYHAPEVFDVKASTVKVTAKDQAGNAVSAIVTVVASPVVLSPSLNVIIEDKSGNTAPIQLKAAFADKPQSLKWSLSEGIGSIDDAGRYTPPQTFPKGMKFIDVIATTEKGNTTKAQLLLQSKSAKTEYDIEPPLVSAVQPGQSITFETVAIENLVIVDSWAAYPAVGTFSQQEEIEQDEDSYLCKVTWTAPASIAENQPVYIQAQSSSPLRSGYALIELVNKA